MILLPPGRAFRLLSGQIIGPQPSRKIIDRLPLFIKDRSHQQTVPQHILFIQKTAVAVILEFQRHTAQHWNSGSGCHISITIKIGQKFHLKFCKETYHIYRFLIIQPWHTVRLASMESAMGGQQPERRPSLIDVRRRRTLKPADIMAPETESTAGQRQAAS